MTLGGESTRLGMKGMDSSESSSEEEEQQDVEIDLMQDQVPKKEKKKKKKSKEKSLIDTQDTQQKNKKGELQKFYEHSKTAIKRTVS